MLAATFLFLAQLVLTPCTINGVNGPTRCGNYQVWENRSTQQGRNLDLSIIVIESLTTPKQADPLFVIAGGPGDAPSFNASFFSRAFGAIRQTRDLVLVDLRGTGKSNALTCPELNDPDETGYLDENILSLPALKRCRARLEQSADLRQYTTQIAVDDLEDVRRALGYGQINLYGTSYGTRVAQVYMRRHAASLRTVSMKGVVPPSLASPSTHARAGEEAWQRLIKRCREDALCAREYPTPNEDLQAVLKRLESTPAFSVPVKIRISPGLFSENFRFFLYSPENEMRGLQLLKDIVHLDKPGLVETSLAARRLLAGDRLAAGFFLSVSCTEDIPFLPKDTASLVTGTFGGDYRLKQQIGACTVWPNGTLSSGHRTVTKSIIPTLLMSGEFDPVTPPSGAEEVLKGLSRGLHVVVRNNGHPIGSAEQCIGNMIKSFIDKGEVKQLDTSCADKNPPVPFKL